MAHKDCRMLEAYYLEPGKNSNCDRLCLEKGLNDGFHLLDLVPAIFTSMEQGVWRLRSEQRNGSHDTWAWTWGFDDSFDLHM